MSVFTVISCILRSMVPRQANCPRLGYTDRPYGGKTNYVLFPRTHLSLSYLFRKPSAVNTCLYERHRMQQHFLFQSIKSAPPHSRTVSGSPVRGKSKRPSAVLRLQANRGATVRSGLTRIPTTTAQRLWLYARSLGFWTTSNCVRSHA